jgi:hypothetical protein
MCGDDSIVYRVRRPQTSKHVPLFRQRKIIGSEYLTAVERTGHLVRALLPKARLCDFVELVRTSGMLLHECSLKKTSLEESFFNLVKGDATLTPIAPLTGLVYGIRVSIHCNRLSQNDIFSMGQADMNKLWDTSFQTVANDEVLIFEKYTCFSPPYITNSSLPPRRRKSESKAGA